MAQAINLSVQSDACKQEEGNVIQEPRKAPKKIKVKRHLGLNSSDYKQKRRKRAHPTPAEASVQIPQAVGEEEGIAAAECLTQSVTKPNTEGVTHEVAPEKTSGCPETDKEEVIHTLLPGELVWGKLKGYDWWPGCILSSAESCKGPPNAGNHWVKWFGDNKLSQISEASSIVPFGNFREKHSPAKMRGMYKKSVYLALEVAVKRCHKSFSKVDLELTPKKVKGKSKQAMKQAEEVITNVSGPVDSHTLTMEELHELMLSWALTDFQPTGPQGFMAKVYSGEDMPQTSSVASDVKATPVNKAEQERARFGKPVIQPNLAQGIKALFDEVAAGKRDIEDICLACGDLRVATQHPLFYGGLCKECKQTFLECAYLFDEDGSQMYCTICGDGKEVFMCDNTGCFRSYCGLCIEMLCGVGAVVKIGTLDQWKCHMCTGRMERLLKRRKDWQDKLRELFMNDNETEFGPMPVYSPISPEERKPIRVLALFDGIATGLQALKELGIQVETYCAAEIDEQAMQVAKVHHGDTIQHLGDVQQLTEQRIQELGPFDLVIGGSPCNDLSIANPIRRGIFEGSGRLFFEFFRLLIYARPQSVTEKPFFWLFENVVGMRAIDKRAISRFLQCNPVVVDAKDMSPAHRARYFWGNAPGMNRVVMPLPGDKLTLQECLETNCGRHARFDKVQTITTNANSMRQTKKGLLPVEVSGSCGQDREDVLWCTEMERLFGFPSHYTDVNNMGRTQRQRLLGSAWSVPVIRHLLSPLKDYFKCGA